MNKKLLATLVATMAVGTTAFAANPFQDVPQDSWAYNSVVVLTAFTSKVNVTSLVMKQLK